MKSTSFLFSTVLALSSVATEGCGRYEFFEWNQLPENIITAAQGLGYDEMTWNNVGTNPIEFLNFENLVSGGEMTTGLVTGDVLAHLTTLSLFDGGIDRETAKACWDFYVNHYNGFTWDAAQDLTNPFGDNVAKMAEILGWDQAMWEEPNFTGPVPESECKTWLELTPTEKYALQSIGWNAAKWFNSPCGKYSSIIKFLILFIWPRPSDKPILQLY